jgi:uncharacterized protein
MEPRGAGEPAGSDAERIGDPAPAPGAPVRAAPREHDRLLGIDVARGFALLGILIVNVEFFALPFGEAMGTSPPAKGLALALWWMEKTLFEGKFYPLFSLLFGIGLVMQRRSVIEAGARFVPLYLRRIAVLAAIGLLHAFGLWYGDILFFYSVAALLLLAAVEWARRFLLPLGLACLAIALLLGLATAPFQVTDDVDPTSWREVEIRDEPLRSLLESGVFGGPEDPKWMAAEARVYREGPWSAVVVLRAMTWAMFAAAMLFGGGFDILACFLLGAALFDRGAFAPEGRPLRVRLLRAGALVGLPLALLSTAALALGDGVLAALLWQGTLILAGPLLALGYLAGWTLLADSEAARPVVAALSAAGRMALTNYLCQSVVMTFLFYHWGLGWFGTVARADRVGLALLVFIAQVLLSVAWTRRFRFGPAEWLWRTLTYGRLRAG